MARVRGLGAASWLALTLVLAACSGGGTFQSPSASDAFGASATPAATGLAHFSQNEWSFDYPVAWSYYPIEGFVFSFYSVQGYLASAPVETSKVCQRTENSISCGAHDYDLPPDNVVITIGNGGMPMSDPVAFFDHPSEGIRTAVGGMAAIFSEEQQASDRILLTWKIESPTAFDNWVQLDADIRGPGGDALRAQVSALIASFRFTPEPTPISSDPAVAQAIATKALLQLKTDAAFACFPDQAGTSRQTSITSVPFGPTLSRPVPVTCSVSISPTDIGFWKLDLTISWEASGSRQAGTNVTTQWLAPDGSLGASTSTGDTPDS